MSRQRTPCLPHTQYETSQQRPQPSSSSTSSSTSTASRPAILHYFPAPPLPNNDIHAPHKSQNPFSATLNRVRNSFIIKVSDYLRCVDIIFGENSLPYQQDCNSVISLGIKQSQPDSIPPYLNQVFDNYFYCYDSGQQERKQHDKVNKPCGANEPKLPHHLILYYQQEYLYQKQISSLRDSTIESPKAVNASEISTIMQSSTKSDSQPSSPKLIWLLFMHRHGDRAPLNMAPKDKYNDLAYWPEGFGNLNNAGRKRMYKLGQYIRRRYQDFLSDNIREVYSRSSDVDRCIESSHAVLAGLYPPSERFQWDKQLRWIPAPVHSVPAPEDYLINEAGRKFLVEVVREIHIVQNSEAVKKLYDESVEERALLQRELGYEYDMFYKFKCTYSTLDIEERQGLPMPDWYNPELKKKLYKFAGKAFALAGGGTENLKRLRCGHLLDDIIARMEIATVEEPKPRQTSDFHQPTNAPSDVGGRKVVHYSTHDSIIAAFLEALGVGGDEPVPPGFGSTFFIELYVDLDESGLPSGEKYIKIFYMDDTESENPVEMKLPESKLNEKDQLTLKEFKRLVAHLLPTIQNADC